MERVIRVDNTSWAGNHYHVPVYLPLHHILGALRTSVNLDDCSSTISVFGPTAVYVSCRQILPQPCLCPYDLGKILTASIACPKVELVSSTRLKDMKVAAV